MKMIVVGTLVWKLEAMKDLDRPLSKKHRFGTPLDSQHVKGSQTYIKSGRDHFDHIFSLL